jgi:hypothetical protein
MSKHRASCWISLCSLLALTPVSASPAPRSEKPCKQMQHSLDRQIDDLKTQQKDELLRCEQSNGHGSGACLSLKDQQQQTLRAMRDGRTNQMNDCYGRPFLSANTLRATESEYHNYYDQASNEYPDKDRHHHKVPDPHPRHPRHHPTATNGVKSASSDKPSKDNAHSVTKTSHPNAGAGGSSGAGSTTSASHNHNGGGGSSSGGGSYSGPSHSSGGGSYSGGSSGASHSSGGGSSSYSGGSSGSSGSSASSHSSGGGGGSYSGGASSSGSSSSSSSSASSGGHPK